MVHEFHGPFVMHNYYGPDVALTNQASLEVKRLATE